MSGADERALGPQDAEARLEQALGKRDAQIRELKKQLAKAEGLILEKLGHRSKQAAGCDCSCCAYFKEKKEGGNGK